MSISIAAFFSEPSLLTSSPNCLGGEFINPARNQVRHSRIRERRFLLSMPRDGIRTRNFERDPHPTLSRVRIADEGNEERRERKPAPRGLMKKREVTR
jgi:hypothetical protein